ncbi:MAG: 6-carboxytetrahydropterin synthase [Proteobacteria bacterium]|jgi:6-pyruvoyltetrahydropterin/6-carboxytetrahydropterin synthase|nr:6-carboxytetrahydropterin synthase [Pseudomonadota bacterium]
MFSVTVRDSVMIAHSLKGAVFGPAQRLHGATFVIEVTLRRGALDENGIVADIGRATTLLSEILETYAYRNLDDLAEFAGRNSTTEVLAKEIHDRYADGIRAGRLEGDAHETIVSLGVVLRENPDAWAGYDAPLQG